MNIDFPTPAQVPALKQLYQIAFGDTDAQTQLFFSTAFSPRRCRCLTQSGSVAAALYWFDCRDEQGKIAYLYAVATDPAFRGQGLCRRLMEDTHSLLAEQGYRAAILVPGSESLFSFYATMGYQSLNCMDTLCFTAGDPVPITALSPEAYAEKRRHYLPQGGVIQEEENLTYLSGMARFLAGEDFLLACGLDGSDLIGLELLGQAQNAPGVLAALGVKEGRFRIPGTSPFAMFKMLNSTPPPAYFGLALD